MADNPTTVVTPKAILSYPHLDQPQLQKNPKPGDKPKYSLALVFPAGTDMTALQNAALAAAEKKWPGKAAEMFKVGALRSPFRKDGESKGYPAGSIFVNARSEQKPGMVYLHAGPDQKPAKVAAEDVREVFYPGCFVRAQLNFFAYDNSGNKGVSCAPNNIQKLGDGDRLDNRQAAEDAFEADLNAAPADISGLL